MCVSVQLLIYLDGPLWVDVLASGGEQESEEPAELHEEEETVVVGLLWGRQCRRLELEYHRTELWDMEQGLRKGRDVEYRISSHNVQYRVCIHINRAGFSPGFWRCLR